MMKNYSIAGCNFKANFSQYDGKFDLFETNGTDYQAQITVGGFDAIGSASFGVEYISKRIEHFMRSQKNPSSILVSNLDWSETFISAAQDGDLSEELAIASVYSVLCSFKTLFLHASAIDYNGNGVIFVGPSGIGKTTQAELWNACCSADIINGDKAFVRIEADGAFVYGSPWKGSSPYCLNRKVPLKALVVLRQSKTNRIKALNAVELVEYFVPHVFLPHWDEKCMNAALETLNEIISCVPVFLLECRPDEEAVRITQELVLGE